MEEDLATLEAQEAAAAPSPSPDLSSSSSKTFSSSIQGVSYYRYFFGGLFEDRRPGKWGKPDE
jgi:hypothetical protein